MTSWAMLESTDIANLEDVQSEAGSAATSISNGSHGDIEFSRQRSIDIYQHKFEKKMEVLFLSQIFKVNGKEETGGHI